MTKIAIVGSGISGLMAAYTLSPRHEVELFESNHRAGGHANTVLVNDAGTPTPIDTGFIVFNDQNYPVLCSLFDRLGVASHDSDMSFSVHCETTGREWNGSSLNQVFGQRSNVLRPTHWQMLLDVLKFHKEAPAVLEALSDSVTVEQWMAQNRYSEAFCRYYLLPLGASLWSCSASHFAQFPMKFVIEFLHNHRMLQVEDRPQWKTVSGGSISYVNAIRQSLGGRIRLKEPVRKVRRVPRGVQLELSGGRAEWFDEVILACHADEALRLLDKPHDDEREILSFFPYQKNVAVLHRDTGLLPKRERLWGSWNFRLPANDTGEVNVTYNMNMLQGLRTQNTWCVSLNPGDTVNPTLVDRTFVYHHPSFVPGRSSAQAEHDRLIRRQGISYCGAYWGYGFHEDGARSALRVANAFEVELRSAA